MNHYEVLGVAPDAPLAEIRRAYLRTVLADADADAADDERERRSGAAGAWAVLRDPAKRSAYDQQLAAAPDASRAAHPPLPDDVPVVAPVREPSRLARDRPGDPSGPDLRPARLTRVMDVFPAAVIAIGVVLALGAWVVGSGGLLLFGLLLLAIGVVSFILIPLFENINDR